jgi:hypothetical protein
VLNLSWNGYLKDGRDTQYHMASKFEPSDFVPAPNELELARQKAEAEKNLKPVKVSS